RDRRPARPPLPSDRLLLLAAAARAGEAPHAHLRAGARARRRSRDAPGQCRRVPLPRRGRALQTNSRRDDHGTGVARVRSRERRAFRIVCGREISVRGRVIRMGRLAADGYEFVDDPAETLTGLRTQRRRVDVFTFAQELPDTAPKHEFPMEWDNVAA